MATNAPMIRYVAETVAAFEQHQSVLRLTATTEHMRDGNIATFLVAGSGGREATTRGLDGRIPGNAPVLTQNQCTLVEWHDKEVRTDFNVFESQGDARRISQMDVVGVINRKIDADILGNNGLGAATLGDSVAQQTSLDWILSHQAALGENEVPIDEEDNVFCAITPRLRSKLFQIKEFGSGEYVEIKPFNGPARKMYRWAGINFLMSTRLSGMTTESATCYMWHRSALGHAIANGHPDVDGDYNREDKYWWHLASAYIGSKLLQNTGVRKMLHVDNQ